jgi:hypothetical protein
MHGRTTVCFMALRPIFYAGPLPLTIGSNWVSTLVTCKFRVSAKPFRIGGTNPGQTQPNPTSNLTSKTTYYHSPATHEAVNFCFQTDVYFVFINAIHAKHTHTHDFIHAEAAHIPTNVIIAHVTNPDNLTTWRLLMDGT